MKKILIFVCFLFFVPKLFGQQRLEAFGGYLINHFHDSQNDDGYIHSSYTSGKGFSAGISIEDTILKLRYFKFSFFIENYYGTFMTSNYSPGGGSNTYGDAEKLNAGLTIFPLNYSIKKRLWINLGVTFSVLLEKEITGYHHASRVTGYYFYERLEDHASHYVPDLIVGLTPRVAYEIRISNGWYIEPQYHMFLGFSSEFHGAEAAIRSTRHYFEFVVGKKLK